MASTFVLIASNILTSSSSTVTFNNIPQTYNDLYITMSVRDTAAQNWAYGVRVWLNTFVGSGNYRYSVDGNGTNVTSTDESNIGWFRVGQAPAASATADVFSNDWLYIPDYVGNYYKPMFSNGVGPSASLSEGYIISGGGYSNINVPVTSVSCQSNSGSFDTGSSFYLYGISNT